MASAPYLKRISAVHLQNLCTITGVDTINAYGLRRVFHFIRDENLFVPVCNMQIELFIAKRKGGKDR